MSKRKLSAGEIEDLIQHLQGTIMSLDSAVEEMFGMDWMDLDVDALAEIDNSIFCCESCGWWCEVSEMSMEVPDDLVCQGCEDEYLG